MSRCTWLAAWGMLSTGPLGCGGAPPAAPPPSAAARQVTAAAQPQPDEPEPIVTSKKVTLRRNIAFMSCHVSFQPSGGDPTADVVAMAQRCADVTGMHAVEPPVAASAPQSFPLRVEAGHCYRVYGVASGTVKDLDVRIKDSRGEVAGQDETNNATPVLSEDGAVCFDTSEQATVEVAIGAGAGAYAVQVWSD